MGDAATANRRDARGSAVERPAGGRAESAAAGGPSRFARLSVLLPLTVEWRAARERKRKAIAFLAAVRREPEESDVRWLAEVAARDDQDHARWELRYARLALAVLTAQRDALDDRTGSEVVAALGEALAEDPRVDPLMLELVRRQLNDRLSGYNEALVARA